MRLDEFDFELPETLIALRPAEPRDQARLLTALADAHLADKSFRDLPAPLRDKSFGDLPALLRRGDLLVLNDTKVLPARLIGIRRRGAAAARIEFTLLGPLASDAGLNDKSRVATCRALARPAKRLQLADVVEFDGGLTARITEAPNQGEVDLAFFLKTANGNDLPATPSDLISALALAGEMPLPPYILAKRHADARDRRDYQTVYAAKPGAVAAPTAGLHFTPELFQALEKAGIARVFVTLHVGAGTFLPVKTERVQDHRMHSEFGEITAAAAAAINAARAAGGRIVAVGTTALRLLESAADEDGEIRPFAGDTRIFITPGYRFRTASMLLTNFHLPRSTLFMLVAAFVGLRRAQAIYAHAIANRYRFYSYGDACLLERSAHDA